MCLKSLALPVELCLLAKLLSSRDVRIALALFFHFFCGRCSIVEAAPQATGVRFQGQIHVLLLLTESLSNGRVGGVGRRFVATSSIFARCSDTLCVV